MVECSSKSFYLIGLTGSGMASIARVLVRFGYHVAGWDDNPDPVILNLLQKEGIEHIHWESLPVVDCMVFSTAISEDHPGYRWFKDQLLPIYHRSDILAWLSNRIPTIAVCGSHGKTTTTSMIHHVLTQLKIPHVVILGGLLNGEVGGEADFAPQFLVIEACESDRTFLKYHAKYVILTNISPDHLEYYDHDMGQLIRSFSQWLNRLSPMLLLPEGDGSIKELVSQLCIPFKNIGPCGSYAMTTALSGMNSKVTLSKGDCTATFDIPAPGEFNAMNAAMVISMMDMMGMPLWDQPNIFKDYRRVARRFEYQLIKKPEAELHWISDYGHHPKEILAMLQTVRSIWPNLPIRMIFEPHRYSRTQALFADFTSVLGMVDELLLLPVYAASEKAIEGISSDALIASINSEKHRVIDPKDLMEAVNLWAGTEGVVLFQGAGTVHGHALAWLKACSHA